MDVFRTLVPWWDGAGARTLVRRASRLVEPVANVVHAARRPTSYTGQLRELGALAVTASVWPAGFGRGGEAALQELEDRPSPIETPVLLVHGWGANRSNWFLVQRQLRLAGFGRVHALNYNPFTGDIPALAEQCATRAEALRDRFGVERIHVVGHSLGGVIARYAIQVLDLEGVDVCVTVASPHGGVRLARYGSPFAVLSPLASGLQLRPDSPVMEELRATARPLPTRFVAYYSNLDMVVRARRAMILEPELGATNILAKDRGHLSIMLSRDVCASVVGQLAAAEGVAGYGSPVQRLAAADRTGTAAEARQPLAG
jgi:pimeloyl-ACP methyl ester carboxylesterase